MNYSKQAQQYIDAGFSILPVKKDKSPSVGKWKDIEFKASDFKDCEGIGIMCGKVSYGLECFDFDNHFSDAQYTLTDFINIPEINEIYKKYKLPIQATQSGGYHLLYRCDFYEGNQKLASKPKKNDKGKYVPDSIIETRGDGGYFCAYPTEKYSIIRNNILDVKRITPEERKTLISTARSFNKFIDIRKYEQEKDNKPGDVFNAKPEAIDEMKSVLLQNGWTEINQYNWRRPGKKEGISATIGKVADNVFYVFTSNAYPFEEMSGYTPFQVIGLLKYNGDFSVFAKELAEKYDLTKYQNTKQNYNTKPDRKKKTDIELNDILHRSFIDPTIPIDKPPVILEINHGNNNFHDFKRLLTLGNLSTFTGKGKSKKTFLTSIVLATMAKNNVIQHKFLGHLPENKRTVLHFDTEQGEYDSYLVAKRIHDISGNYMPNMLSFNLREYDPYDRIDIISNAITTFKDTLGFVMIDGVADLVMDFNDVNESNKVVTLLMEWTKKFNIHISTIIHQNKNDNFATGHLGSALIKKAEVVISVEKDETYPIYSDVLCQNIRGAMEFEKFSFFINDKGLPEINWGNNITKKMINHV